MLFKDAFWKVTLEGTHIPNWLPLLSPYATLLTSYHTGGAVEARNGSLKRLRNFFLSCHPFLSYQSSSRATLSFVPPFLSYHSASRTTLLLVLFSIPIGLSIVSTPATSVHDSAMEMGLRHCHYHARGTLLPPPHLLSTP